MTSSSIERRLRREDMEDKFKKKKNEARMAVCSRRTSTHQRGCKQCGLQAHVGWSLAGD